MKPIKNKPGLVQLHHQPKKGNGDTIFCAQRNIGNHHEMVEFVKETQDAFPVPGGYMWMACNQYSKQFILTHREMEAGHIKIDC